MAKKSTGGAMPPKPPKPPKRPKRTRDEEVIEPEDIEEVDDEDIDDDPDFAAEMDIEEDEDDRRVRIELDMDGIFGRDGIFGDRGPFGSSGPFGPNGVFGPGGVFAKTAKMQKMGRGAHKMQRAMQRGDFGGGRGPRRRERVFGPGQLRLTLLAMLAEEPRHGYELIKSLEEMTEGVYSPSPGVVYPTLQMLADEGVIAEQASDDAKKLYQATEAGIAELEDRKDEIEALWERLGRKTERARAMGGSPDIFRALGNLASVISNRAQQGGVKGVDKDKVVDLIDELARKIERL